PQRAPEERPALAQHPFFAAVSHAIRTRVKGLNIPEPFREQVFKDLLAIKFSVWLSETEALVRRVTSDLEMPQEEFRSIALAYCDHLMEQFEMQACSQGIPAKVICRYSLWNGSAMELIHSFVERVADSRWYPSTEDRLYAVLSYMTSMIDLCLVDAEDALARLNGELDGIRYAGLISHCKRGDRCEVCTNPARLRPPQDANDSPKDGQV
ncbi:MAG TPA: hypothetical protein VN436_16645, partial [Holophaga sp.]|nr:hypothetical protein [Holophaga sp.]